MSTAHAQKEAHFSLRPLPETVEMPIIQSDTERTVLRSSLWFFTWLSLIISPELEALLTTIRLFVGFVMLLGATCTALGEYEQQLSSEEWEKLDTFENHMLVKANKTFSAGEWRQAYAEYESFVVEFPRSKVLPFVLLRKGRSKQNDDKKFAAINEYDEVLDYFPNAIDYASSALYRIGECHWANGDVEKAMKAWAEMANDEDYSKHVHAARAINALAENLLKQDKEAEAVKYYQQVAIDFRKKNHDAANSAAGPVYRYYIRTVQSEEKYREFYKKIHSRGKKEIPLEEDTRYWQTLMSHIGHYGRFEEQETDLKEKYFTYWTGRLKGKFPDNDGYQLTLLNWQFELDKNVTSWTQGVEKQFQRGFKPGDYARVLKWMGILKKSEKKVDEYYQKLDLSKMSHGQVGDLISFLYSIGRNSQGRNTLKHVKFDKLTDDEIEGMAGRFHRTDGALVKEISMRMKDKDRARNHYMGYCHWCRNSAEGLPYASELTKVDKYAKRAWSVKGDFLQWTKKYKEAITAYRMADNPPGNLWQIASCQTHLKEYPAAIGQLREIENFFEKERSRAAFEVANVYNRAGDKKRYIASLRAVLKKYPKSGQSSEAHQRLEQLGVRIGGAVDAE